MGKSSHFLGQPLYGQVIKLLDKAEILEISRKNGGERYIKRFDAWTHLMTMLYAVIMRHDPTVKLEVQQSHRPPSSLERSGKGEGGRWKSRRVAGNTKIKKGDLSLPRMD